MIVNHEEQEERLNKPQKSVFPNISLRAGGAVRGCRPHTRA